MVINTWYAILLLLAIMPLSFMHCLGIEVIRIGAGVETLVGLDGDLMNKTMILNGISTHNVKSSLANAHKVRGHPGQYRGEEQRPNLAL